MTRTQSAATLRRSSSGCATRPLTHVAALLLAAAVALPAVEQVHRLRSPRQAGETNVRVFVPDNVNASTPARLLLVLPVEPGTESRWGDPAAEVRRTNLANRHRLVVAIPTFSALPWYADHPTNQRLQQESYLLRDVLPLIDRYHGTESSGGQTLVVGFSKSGWGAWSLLLRHPEVFASAAAWDAPLMQRKPDKYGMGPIFGSQDNFNRYLVSDLVRHQANLLRQRERLVLTGYFESFRDHHISMHTLLEELGVPHAYRDGPKRDHHWESGWLEETVELLVGLGIGSR